MKDKYNEKRKQNNYGQLRKSHLSSYTGNQFFWNISANSRDRMNSTARCFSVSRLQHLKKNETVIFHDRCYPVVVRDLPLILNIR